MINNKLKFAFLGYILCRSCFSFLFLSAVLAIHATFPATTHSVLEVFSHGIFLFHIVRTIGHDSKAFVDATGIVEIPGQIGWVDFFISIDDFRRGRNHRRGEVQPIIYFRTLFFNVYQEFLA